jgi:hypothetical protein
VDDESLPLGACCGAGEALVGAAGIVPLLATRSNVSIKKKKLKIPVLSDWQKKKKLDLVTLRQDIIELTT